MSEGQVNELYEEFGLSRPDVPVQTSAVNPGLAAEQLTEFLTELGSILSEVERIKRLCHSPADWPESPHSRLRP